jgi:hypothetical protein
VYRYGTLDEAKGSTTECILLKFQGLSLRSLTWVYFGSSYHFKIIKGYLIIKPTRCTNFSNLFWKWNSIFSNISSAHHQELFTVHSVVVYVIQVCRQLSNCSKAVCMTNTITECTVNNSWWWTEELSENTEFHFQNEFEKLVHLVGFIAKKFVTMDGHMNVKL